MKLASFLAAILLLLPSYGFAADPIYDLTVTTDSTKANGSPWDGVPGLRNSKINLNAAPDIAVCIVRSEGKPDCLWKPDGRRLFSNCQNAWTCKFEKVALPSPPIGLVFIDIDARNHDIIDVVILGGNESASADADLKDAIRAAMTTLTPVLSEDAKSRWLRASKLIPLQDCTGDKPCRLTQSEFRLEIKN